MASAQTARFVWFWTFWHWTRESFRDGALLRSPLHGIGSHWDEWYRHEASAGEREAIERAGRTEPAQRQFIAWLLRRWAVEAAGPGRQQAYFMVSQLARQEPFTRWKAFGRFQGTYGVTGVSAVVLGEKSPGGSDDVRSIEAVALPVESAGSGPRIIAEGFTPDGAELNLAQQAAANLLGGRGLLGFLALWLVSGRRPGSRWSHALLIAGWLVVGVGFVSLLVGPDPRGALVPVCAILAGLWALLVLHALGVAAVEGTRAWWQGRLMAAELQRSQVRVRMEGGLHLQGASAGLAVCLNTLLALVRAGPPVAHRSWLWQRSLGGLQREAGAWAATGVVTGEGWLQPVALEPKLRACVAHPRIRHLLTPHQPDARQRAVDELIHARAGRQPERPALVPAELKLGFAASRPALGLHACRHLAQVMMSLGRLTSPRQMVVNVYALVVSAGMILAAPDLAHILVPPPAPAVVSPSSASPYYLWVSLDTRSPKSFRVQLESDFWVNRVAEVKDFGGTDIPPRAELHIQRLPDHLSTDEDNGTIWIERRRSVLHREFRAGERVGGYPLYYVNRLSHE
jgi:hypothetical protein